VSAPLVVSVGKGKTLNPKITDVPLYAVTFKVGAGWKGSNDNEVTVLVPVISNAWRHRYA
jgi:hypothetical protein